LKPLRFTDQPAVGFLDVRGLLVKRRESALHHLGGRQQAFHFALRGSQLRALIFECLG
jgi:hypothetical protein